MFVWGAAGGETKVVHRIAVFESHGEITNVISQTDVMRCVMLVVVVLLLPCTRCFLLLLQLLCCA